MTREVRGQCDLLLLEHFGLAVPRTLAGGTGD